MKIKYNKDGEITIFGRLKVGDIFKYDDTIYMKSCTGLAINATCLNDGLIEGFNYAEIVYKLDCELVIN